MAQLNYDDFLKMTSKKSSSLQSFSNNNFKWFKLKDGETALVRFNLKSIDDLKIYSQHIVKLASGKWNHINCLRGVNDSIDICPLCASGDQRKFRCLIQLARYNIGDNKVNVEYCIWDQPARIRETLKSYSMDYGDLRKYLFKISRHGVGQSTNHTIIPANMNMYNGEEYQTNFEAFQTFHLNDFIRSKTKEEMEEYLKTGEFPFVSSKTNGGYSRQSSQTDSNANNSNQVEIAQIPSDSKIISDSNNNLENNTQESSGQSSSNVFRPRRYTY